MRSQCWISCFGRQSGDGLGDSEAKQGHGKLTSSQWGIERRALLVIYRRCLLMKEIGVTIDAVIAGPVFSHSVGKKFWNFIYSCFYDFPFMLSLRKNL
ncbi:hypothetical protein CEXT_366981 [Caerostris extrusa]|uniref:Uncharacterized protein n=1 Tax=Caerostris extrusa TaxID=172846 RepID=A0AAV4PZQ9_CAEEX|nr:hypothetical protein CEXT_366981 [Caerostris extrusa]